MVSIRDDFESLVPTLNGIVVKEASAHPSNFRQQKTLHDVLELHQIPGLQVLIQEVLRVKFDNTVC